MPRYKAGLKRMVDGVAQYGRPIEVAGLKKSLNELYDVKNQTGLNSTSLLSAVGGTLGNSQVENLNENGLTSALKNKSATLSSLMANNSSLSSKNLVGNISQLENKISLSYFVNYLLPRDPNTLWIHIYLGDLKLIIIRPIRNVLLCIMLKTEMLDKMYNQRG